MSDTKIIIFDFDGVIVDTTKLAYEFTKWEWPEITEEQHAAMFDGNIFEAIDHMPPSTRTKEEKAVYREEVHLPGKKKIMPYEGMHDVIAALSKKYTLVINSSSTEHDIEDYLSSHEMGEFFTRVYGKETSRNKVEKFNAIMKDFDVTKEECVFITDTLGDVLEAQVLEIPTIVATYGYQKEPTFDTIRPKLKAVVHTPEEILQII